MVKTSFISVLMIIVTLCFFVSAKAVNKTEQEPSSNGCTCANYTCGCCLYLHVPEVGLNDTGCVNITYLPKEYGMSLTMTIDDLTIFNETISARNPPPYCFGAPILKEYADLCIHFYDLNVTMHTLHGCVKLEARVKHVVVANYKVGCFNLGGVKWKHYFLSKDPPKTPKEIFIPRVFLI